MRPVMPTGCPEATAIADLLEGLLPGEGLVAMEGHLDVCSHCADLVALAVSSHGSDAREVQTIGLAGRGRYPIFPANTTLGRYQVRRWIGRGGMGDVYEGFDPQLERRVAIKVLLERGDEGQRELSQRRLEREAKALARLSSPHVVAVLDIGVFTGRMFVVMELVEGMTLAAWLRAAPPSWREVLETYLTAGEGLAAAHEVGIIHRDFKPQNVLLGPNGRVRVSDFGLARARQVADDGDDDGSFAPPKAPPGAAGGDLTKTGAVLGTPRYMAPEQFLAEPIDARADQFSFCVALYEALYGGHPFLDPGRPIAGSFEIFKTATLAGAAAAPSKKAESPRAIAGVLMRGLSRDPDDRYPSMGELLALLRVAAGLTRVGRSRRLVLPLAIAVLGTITVVVAGVRGYRRWSPSSGSRPQPNVNGTVISIEGKTANWTNKSRVLATLNGDATCLVTLPDQRTLRFVWGTPPRAEDMDVTTGARQPSPLVPAAYAEGCPDLAPNGRDLIYQGYDGEGRPVIFHATNPEGRGAMPRVAAAHPSWQSEPKWLAGGTAFAFDMDEEHVGVFDLAADRIKIVPASRGGPGNMFKTASADQVFSIRDLANLDHVDVVTWPALTLIDTFRIDIVGTGWVARGRMLYGATEARIFEIDPKRRTARSIVEVDNETPAYLASTEDGIAFVSSRDASDAWVHLAGAEPRRLTYDGVTQQIASCGDEALVAVGNRNSPWKILRLAADGRAIPTVGTHYAFSPACSRRGDDWWFISGRDPESIQHCQLDRCVAIANTVALELTLSPDESRLAVLTVSNRGLAVGWIARDGGPIHHIADTETYCPPGWSSNDTVWVSRRRKGKLIWTEVNALTGAETGLAVPGGSTCADRRGDPLSPVRSEAKIVSTSTSRVRFIPFGAKLP